MSLLRQLTTASIFIASFFVMHLAQAACVKDTYLKQLNEQEVQYMLNRVPPAFSHAVQDQQIIYTHHVEDQQNCIVSVHIQLPQAHITEAQAKLDSDPSKKILLFAQGYSLPDKTEVMAKYSLDPHTLMANTNETLQSGELGKLRASIEMMYSLITEKRLNELSQSVNLQWSQPDLDKSIKACESSKKSKQYCECNVQFFAQHLQPRDFENLQYSQSNPYAFASVKNDFLSELTQKNESACKDFAKK